MFHGYWQPIFRPPKWGKRRTAPLHRWTWPQIEPCSSWGDEKAEMHRENLHGNEILMGNNGDLMLCRVVYYVCIYIIIYVQPTIVNIDGRNPAPVGNYYSRYRQVWNTEKSWDYNQLLDFFHALYHKDGHASIDNWDLSENNSDICKQFQASF